MFQLRKLAIKIKQSTTSLLPLWKKLCKDLSVKEGLLKRDVQTRWNSTYDMADSCLNFKIVIIAITQDASNGLRASEVTTEEWTILEQLKEVLEVRQLLATTSDLQPNRSCP